MFHNFYSSESDDNLDWVIFEISINAVELGKSTGRDRSEKFSF